LDWCTYFRCKSNKTFDQHSLKLGSLVQGYSRFPIAPRVIQGRNLRGVAFHKSSRPGEPDWLTFLGQLTGVAHYQNALGIYHSAITLLELDNLVFVVAYGSAHSIARKMDVERRFGKIVVSNGKLTDEVRGIKANVAGPYGKLRLERRGRGGPTRVLEVPRNVSALGGVAAKVDLVQEHVADGGVGFRSIAAASEEQLIEVLDQLEVWWNGGIQLDAVLAGYDRIEEVKDSDLLEDLNGELLSSISNLDTPLFSLSLDADELWDATVHQYRVNRQSLAIPVLDVGLLVAALQNAQLAGIDPFTVRLLSTVPPQNEVRETHLLDNLAFELATPVAGQNYVFESGTWYGASASWSAKLQYDMHALQSVKAPTLAALGLTGFTAGQTEDDYIDNVCLTLGDRASKGHRVFPPAQPSLEVADIIVDGKWLLYIKKDTNTKACAEAANQGVQAANALIDEPSYLTWARNTFFAPKGWTIDLQTRDQLTLVIVLLTSAPNRVPIQLTVRAQDALSGFRHEVETRLVFRAAVIAV